MCQDCMMLFCCAVVSTQQFCWTVAPRTMHHKTTAHSVSFQMSVQLSQQLWAQGLQQDRRISDHYILHVCKWECLFIYTGLSCMSTHRFTPQSMLLICRPFSLSPSWADSTWTAHTAANPTPWHLHLECFWFIKSSQHCGKFTFPKSPLERRLKWRTKAGQGENKGKLKGAHFSAQPLSEKPYCVKM